MSDLTIIYNHGMCGYGRLGFLDRRFVEGLRSTGVDTRVNDWARHANPIRNLHDRKQHAAAADQLCEIIGEVRRDQSERRIAIVGHSTGCLVALEAMEKLERPIDAAVLMAAAVDPDYDLSRVADAAGRLVHFYSRLDLIACMVGTWLVGTADHRRSPAAGWAGFNVDNCRAHGVDQRAWRPKWTRFGHTGIHVGYLDPKFAAGVIVPLLLGERTAVSSGSESRAEFATDPS